MEEISVETMIGVHDAIVREQGGDTRVLSEGNLFQLSFRTGIAEDAASQAALVFYCLCAYPAFREGNRRTAYRLAGGILRAAGLRAEPPCEELRSLAQGIEGFTVEPEDVEGFFRRLLRNQAARSDSVT